MEKSSGSTSSVVFYNNSTGEKIQDVTTGATKVFLNLDEEKQDKTAIYTKTRVFENICTYSMSCILSFIIGYSFTSYLLIADHGLRDYSQGFFEESHDFFKNLCPAVLYFGSTVGTFSMLMIKRYSHLIVTQLTAIIFFIGYLLQMVYPHVLVIFLARFLIGLASGIACMIIPQILYFSCKENIRGLFTSFFPFFIMVGLTTAVALMPLVTNHNYNFFNLIPILLSILSLACSLGSFKLLEVKKEKAFIEVTKFMFSSTALKSTVSVVLAHVFQKTTGVDFIGNFSGSLFTGDNAQIKSLSPLLTAGIVNLATGFLPDLFGRKLPIIVNLCLIFLVTLSMGIWGTNVVSLILFTIVYNGGLGAVPYYYQNETVPSKYIPDINEIATFSNVLLALFVAVYAAFLLSPTNTTIWYTFSGLSLLGAFIMGITMPETKGTPVEKRDFIKNWFNFSFKNKNLK